VGKLKGLKDRPEASAYALGEELEMKRLGRAMLLKKMQDIYIIDI